MSGSINLYENAVAVHCLCEADLKVANGQSQQGRQGDKTTRVQIKANKFQGPGVLKAYAHWCGHCKDKVACISEMAEAFHNSNMNVHVYALESSILNPAVSEALGLDSFPTFYQCDENGRLTKMEERTVPSVLTALCTECKNRTEFSSYMGKCGR